MLGMIRRALSRQPRPEPERRYAHAVDLDNPHHLKTMFGQTIWVRQDLPRAGVIVVVCEGSGPCRELKLVHTEAQWLLKAIRQQNNIVKQRLGIAPYDDQRPGSALDQSIAAKSATHAIERALDGKRRPPVDYEKQPKWADKDGFTY